MSTPEPQAGPWARLASAAYEAEYRRAHRPGCSPQLERELQAAVAAAATHARMGWREMLGAYLAGAPGLDVSEARERLEDYLEVAARNDVIDVNQHHRDAPHTLPDWPRRLARLVAEHDQALAAHGPEGAEDERRAVASFLDAAAAAGVSQQLLDLCLRWQRIADCDLRSVLAAAAAIADERARLAVRRGQTLPDEPWATDDEIARHRGVARDVARELVDHAVSRGLLQRVPDRGVTITVAGRAYISPAAGD